MEEQKLLKVILVGASGSGKTNVLSRVTKDQFELDHKATIGVEFASATTGNIKFQIWDTAGQERFQSITTAYYRGGSIVVFVVNATVQGELQQLSKYLENCQANSPEAIKLLLVNKIDLHGRQISTQEAEAFAAQNDMLVLEFSAKDGDKKVVLSKLQEAAEKYLLQSAQ